MKKVAFVFVLAVLLPTLVLAWLALRSQRDQQFLLERQQSLLYQRVTDALAQNISDYLAQRQQEFGAQVENLTAGQDARAIGGQFDNQIRQSWPLADVGFCVTLSGKILSPAANARDEAKSFYLDNSAFLGNHEVAEVYSSINDNSANNTVPIGAGGGQNAFSRASTLQSASPSVLNNNSFGNGSRFQSQKQLALNRPADAFENSVVAPAEKQSAQSDAAAKDVAPQSLVQNNYNYKEAQARKITPQRQAYQELDKTKAEGAAKESDNNLSRVVPAEAEFAQLVGNDKDGLLARFLQNKLKLMFWHRLNRDPDLVFGAQLNLNRVVDGLRDFVQPDPELQNEICLALLDDNAKPVVVSRGNFQANWKHPFVATEIGDALPHWEVAAYLVNPAAITQAAHTARITLGLLIDALLLAFGIGSWLIVRNLNAELKLARQKTDFVSNVSHELKTPLTSIRMFSELLAEGRVADPAKQRSYLNIITAEAARLTRLINNVLDFSRMESGEKKYNFQACDLAQVAGTTAETFRPHLEANGFKFECELPSAPVSVQGDADALSQVIMNLLSNAEKYSNGGKEISLQLALKQSPLPHAEVKVLDRGPGVPRGSEEKVFEKFYRAHDSLGSGIQGSGLGLTIARQIARAHGGDVVYEPRVGGGSCFVLRLPVKTVA